MCERTGRLQIANQGESLRRREHAERLWHRLERGSAPSDGSRGRAAPREKERSQ
jgi:hypothetical protein